MTSSRLIDYFLILGRSNESTELLHPVRRLSRSNSACIQPITDIKIIHANTNNISNNNNYQSIIENTILPNNYTPILSLENQPILLNQGFARTPLFLSESRTAFIAIALGAVVAGLAIQADTREAYVSLLVGRTLAFVGCALVLTRLPGPVRSGTRATDKPGWVALRNRSFLVATVINGAMQVHYAVPTFALPLWIVDHTDAPRWTVSAILLLNTVMVASLQVMAGRSVTSTEAAGKRMLWAGCALCTGLVLMAAASGPTAWVSVLILVAATAVYTAGELWHAAASMEYSFGLADAEAQGQYSGVFRLGAGAGDALAPTVMGVMVLGWGRPGWLVLAGLLLLVGAASRPAVAFAGRRFPG